MDHKDRASLIDNVMNYAVIALAFLMPVFFMPITSEFFEFNKLALLTGATLLLVVLWAIKLLASKKVYTIKSQLNAPIVALAAVFILSTIFSINPNMSIFGKYGRWFPSLFSFGITAVFYYVVAINVTSKEIAAKAVNALVAGVTVSSLVGILSYFGVYVGGAYAQNPNFTLTGSVTTTAILAGLAIALALPRMLSADKTPMKVLWLQSMVVNVLLLVLYGVLAGWVVLGLGVLLMLTYTKAEDLKKNTVYLMSLLGVAVALFLVTTLPQTSSIIVNENFSKEVNLSLIDSWVVSSSTVTDFPLLGSGPSTFGLNFTRYRPIRMNSTDFWNVRFDKPYNELFNVMANLGIVGTIAVVFFGIRAIRFAFQSKRYNDETGTMAMLAVGVVAALAVYLLSYATVLNTFVLYFFLALLTGIYSRNAQAGDSFVEHVQMSLASLSTMSIIGGIAEGTSAKKRETFQYFAVVPMILFVAFVSFYAYRTYAAEYYFRQSIQSAATNNGTETYDNQRLAISANPQRSEYRNTYAQTNLLLASNLATSENLTDTDRSTIQTLIAQAIREARLSTEVVNPLSAGSWEIRAGVYRSLIGVADNASQWALGAYNTAIQLDPTNPRLRLEAGAIYYVNGDYLSAANLFRQATNLKPDYANAHYNLAQALVQLNNAPLALRELQLVARLVDQDSADYARVQEEIQQLQNLVAGQAQGNPTVEDLDQQAQIDEQGTVTEQGGLSNPEQIETITGGDNLELNQNANQGQQTQDQQAQPQGQGQDQGQQEAQ